MRFDARAAKLLAAGDHLTVDGAPGLRLEASATRRSWIYRYKSPVDGRMRQIKLGEWPTMSVAAAMAAWEAQRADRTAGRDPAQDRRREREQSAPSISTVGGLCDAFVAEYAAHRRAPKGLAELRRTFATMLGDVAAMPPTGVTRSVAYDLVNGFAHVPVQAASLRRELGAVWDWAHDSGKLAEELPNWWRLILRGKLKSKGKIVDGQHQGVVKVALMPDQVGAVLRHLPHISRMPAELLTLYLWTGCRGSEICAMEGAEVSEEADGWWWTIPRSKLKMRRHPLATDLRVPLVGRALEIVRARMDVHGQAHLYPPTRGESPHVEQKTVGVAVWWHMPNCTLRPEQERPRWPVVGWSPHDLRRTVRTKLGAMGCAEEVAEAVMGHIQAGVAGVYNRHQYDRERREWLTRMAAEWEAAAQRPA